MTLYRNTVHKKSQSRSQCQGGSNTKTKVRTYLHGNSSFDHVNNVCNRPVYNGWPQKKPNCLIIIAHSLCKRTTKQCIPTNERLCTTKV